MTLTEFIEARLKTAAEPLTAAELANMAILYGGIPESDRGRRASTAVANAMKPLRDQGLIVAGIREDERSPVYSWYKGENLVKPEVVFREGYLALLAAESGTAAKTETVEDDGTSDIAELACKLAQDALYSKPDDLDFALEDPFNGEFVDYMPDQEQAQRWQRICKALSHNPRIKDSIATELYALSDFLTNFT